MLLLCSSCATQKVASGADSKYFFGYEISHQKKIGLVQVFDDKTLTYLQFLPGRVLEDHLIGKSKDGKDIFIKCESKRLCTIKGIYTEFSVNTTFIKRQEVILKLTPSKVTEKEIY